jgi:hypothetical protein
LNRLHGGWLLMSDWRRRPSGGWRSRRRRRSNRTGWRGLSLRQISNCKFHGAVDRDSGNAFVLIDPRVRREILFVFFLQRFQFFHALLCARFFVIT